MEPVRPSLRRKYQYEASPSRTKQTRSSSAGPAQATPERRLFSSRRTPSRRQAGQRSRMKAGQPELPHHHTSVRNQATARASRAYHLTVVNWSQKLGEAASGTARNSPDTMKSASRRPARRPKGGRGLGDPAISSQSRGVTSIHPWHGRSGREQDRRRFVDFLRGGKRYSHAPSMEAPPLNQDLPLQAVPPRAELEISLVEVLAPLRRHSRLILVGIGACWAILLLLCLFAPPRYSCEATLVLPDVIPEESGVDRLVGGLLDVISDGRSGIEPTMSRWRSGIDPTMSGRRSGIEQTRVGIPLVLYKKLERSFSGGAGHVSPVPSGTKDDIQKLEKDDTISAVTLSHESYAANQSRDAVNSLAGLVRETLITALAMEQIESEGMHSRKEALDLFRRKVDLLATNRSLEKLTADLERLARDVPESRAAGREVVDTRDGGYRFLPPQLQIVGAKARHADNEHTIRLLDRALSLHALRLLFLD